MKKKSKIKTSKSKSTKSKKVITKVIINGIEDLTKQDEFKYLENYAPMDAKAEIYIGESIEEKIRRAKKTKEPIESISPIIYTDPKEGIIPEYDIRTDKFEVAQNAIQGVSQARRKQLQKEIEVAKEMQGNNEETASGVTD